MESKTFDNLKLRSDVSTQDFKEFIENEVADIWVESDEDSSEAILPWNVTVRVEGDKVVLDGDCSLYRSGTSCVCKYPIDAFRDIFTVSVEVYDESSLEDIFEI